jgi:hypothetical protein
MDAVERERLRGEIGLLQDSQFVRGVLWMVLVLPAIAAVTFAAVRGEISAVVDAWPWRNAIESAATVERHESDMANGWITTYDHVIDYSYEANGVTFSDTLALRSPSENAIFVGESRLALPVQSKFKIYYRKERPRQPQAFVDPRRVVWDGVWRLAFVAAIVIVMSFLIVFIALAYRPRRRIPSNATFCLPTSASSATIQELPGQELENQKNENLNRHAPHHTG